MGRRTTWASAVVGLLVLTGCSSGAGSSAGGPSPSAVESGVGGDPAAVSTYVAIGDSYSAAPGVPRQDPTDPCLRSSNDYAQLVHVALQTESVDDVSCSGATTADITGSQVTGSGELAPQIDAVDPTTDLVTIGMGGNDFGLFTTLVGRCSFLRLEDPTGSPCRDDLATAGGGNRLLDRLPTIGQRLIAAVDAVHERAPQARIVLVGYPQIVPASGTCPSRLPLAPGDYAFAREVNEGLDRVVSESAAATGSAFADIWTASAGHDLCSAQPWINGRQRSTRAASFHPFVAEQRAVAGLVVQAVGTGA